MSSTRTKDKGLLGYDVAMKTLILALLFSSLSLASLSDEKLKSVFLTTADLGPLSLEKLQEIEDALHEIGHHDKVSNMMSKLGLDQLSSLSSIIHSCDIPPHQLGTYTRGAISTIRKVQSPNADIQDLQAFWGSADILERVNQAYKSYVVDQKSHAELVIIEWPVICIRPDKSFSSVISTFVHESIHFLGDEEQIEQYLDYDSENDYVYKTLRKSGGELEAFIGATQVEIELLKRFPHAVKRNRMLDFFDQNAEVIPSYLSRLENYILQDLGYETSFRTRYRNLAVNSFNKKVHDLNALEASIGLYEYNLEVFQKRYEIYRRQKDSEAMENARKAVMFYENVITFTRDAIYQAQSDMNAIQAGVEKKQSQVRSNQPQRRGRGIFIGTVK